MKIVTGVRFKKPGKIYYFDPDKLQIEKGMNVIVDTAMGEEFGEVVIDKKEVEDNEVTEPLKKVIRIATEKDEKMRLENKAKEKDAFKTCLEKIKKHELPMKLIDAEYKYDGSKLIFYFTADGRIDFRELVKDLAAVFRTRIELRQIGVRDEVKRIGGNGVCGRELCCCTFLNEFDTVSIKMAKNQGLSLNPNSISGLCGKLLCCLAYENPYYMEVLKEMPKVGSTVSTKDGEGKVIYCDLLKKTVSVKYQSETSSEVKNYELGDIKFNEKS